MIQKGLDGRTRSASTKNNSTSSRSHLVITMYLSNGSGAVSFVDLAGQCLPGLSGCV